MIRKNAKMITALLIAFSILTVPVFAEPVKLTASQLERDLSPIALFPDSLLGNILTAAARPDEVVAADAWIAEHANLAPDKVMKECEKEPWDPSVKALLLVPETLKQMCDHMDWTVQVGEAFVSQTKDVMEAVQTLRRRAKDAGNLKDTKDVKVVTDEKGNIIIGSTNSDVIVVPQYSPNVVYKERVVVEEDNTATIVWGSILLAGIIYTSCVWDWNRCYYWCGPCYGGCYWYGGGFRPWCPGGPVPPGLCGPPPPPCRPCHSPGYIRVHGQNRSLYEHPIGRPDPSNPSSFRSAQGRSKQGSIKATGHDGKTRELVKGQSGPGNKGDQVRSGGSRRNGDQSRTDGPGRKGDQARSGGQGQMGRPELSSAGKPYGDAKTSRHSSAQASQQRLASSSARDNLSRYGSGKSSSTVKSGGSKQTGSSWTRVFGSEGSNGSHSTSGRSIASGNSSHLNATSNHGGGSNGMRYGRSSGSSQSGHSYNSGSRGASGSRSGSNISGSRSSSGSRSYGGGRSGGGSSSFGGSRSSGGSSSFGGSRSSGGSRGGSYSGGRRSSFGGGSRGGGFHGSRGGGFHGGGGRGGRRGR